MKTKGRWYYYCHSCGSHSRRTETKVQLDKKVKRHINVCSLPSKSHVIETFRR